MESSPSLSTRQSVPRFNKPEIENVDLDKNESHDDTHDSHEAQSAVQPKGTRSVYWLHCTQKFRKCEDGKEKVYDGVCNYCKIEIPAGSSKNGTSGLKHHLIERCTASPIYRKSEGGKGQSILTNQSMGGSSLVTHVFNQKRCELKVIEFVVKDEMPFRVVDGKGFVALMHEAQPRFKVPNRRKVAAGVYDLFLAEKGKIKSVIRGQRISITTDTWTSIQNINYMVITGHFLDSDWKLHKRILSFSTITSHNGDDIGKKLEMCLNDWGIEKVFSITVDNASSNNTTVDYMKKRFKSLKTLMLDGTYLHLRCACHILNLIVKDGLDELKSSIKGIRNAVVWIHSSPSRLHKFREFAILEKFDNTATVPMDVKTRWNATFKMLLVALKFKRVFDRMGEECLPYVEYFKEKVEKKKGERVKTRVGPPGEDDWEKAESFVHFLGLFYQCTLKLSATKSCTSHLLLLSIMALQLEIEKKVKDITTNFTLHEVASSMKKKFEKYWNLNEVNQLIFVASVLDPRYKFQMIKVSLNKIGETSFRIQEFIDKVKASLQSLWVEYKGGPQSDECSSSINKGQRMEIDVESDSGLFDCLNDAIDRQNEVEQLQEISNEVDKYLADQLESRNQPDFDLLSWWKGSETRYPVLSKIAKDVLAIPSSTVASESAFSLGKRIVDPFRSRLSPKMVEALMCGSDWLRADEFSLYKDPTDDELEFYREIEEIEAIAAKTQASGTGISTSTQLPPSTPSSVAS